jgi:Flp pilus assembly pilin Flp
MQDMLNRFTLFANVLLTRIVVGREEGQAMVEYGIILGLISVVAIGSIVVIGKVIGVDFEAISTKI